MNITPISWRAAPYAPPKTPFAPQRLGQSQASVANAFMDSPGLAFGVDIVAAAGSGYLAYGFSKLGNSTWSTVWLVAATAAAVKALHDLSRLNA